MDAIVLDPGEPGFDPENTLCATLVNVVVVDYCITGSLTSKGNIGFEVCIYLILLNVPGSAFYQKYTLSEVTKYAILKNGRGGALEDFDTCQTIRGDGWILFYASVIVRACTHDPVVFVLLDVVELDGTIASQKVLRDGNYSVLDILSDPVHENDGVG